MRELCVREDPHVAADGHGQGSLGGVPLTPRADAEIAGDGDHPIRPDACAGFQVQAAVDNLDIADGGEHR